VGAYRQAQLLAADKSRWGEVQLLLYANNQRLRDLRDGYMLLRDLYRQAWLRDNRLYWLDNNLAHYDRAAQLWAERNERWTLLSRQWGDIHTLPGASEVGLPAGK